MDRLDEIEQRLKAVANSMGQTMAGLSLDYRDMAWLVAEVRELREVIRQIQAVYAATADDLMHVGRERSENASLALSLAEALERAPNPGEFTQEAYVDALETWWGSRNSALSDPRLAQLRGK